MNTEEQITRDNIQLKERRIRYILYYFNNWLKMRDIRKSDKNSFQDKIWDKSIMLIITFSNMHLTEIGFLECCRFMLQKLPDLMFIAMLHSNTSSLEEVFSSMHFYDSDSTDSYKGNMSIVDNEKAMELR